MSRCEVDLVDIKVEFQSKYHKTLGSFIKVSLGQVVICAWLIFVFRIPDNSLILQGDASGDYKRVLMALARED